MAWVVKLAGYLEQRRAGFEAVVDVPVSLREAVGRKRLRKGLGTRDVHVARSKLTRALVELHSRIDDARRKVPALDLVMVEAMQLRQSVADLRAGDFSGFGLKPSWEMRDGEMVPVDNQGFALGIMSEHIETRAGAVTVDQGESRGETFAKVALGSAMPLLLNIEAWLAEPGQKGPYRGRTLLDYRRMVEAFARWMDGEGLGSTVEAVTRRVAGRYLALLHGQALSPARVRTVVAAPSGYFQWMVRRGIVPPETVNPWTGQAPRKAQGAPQEPERPFTDAEVSTLLASPPDATLGDLMTLAALSGVRIEEACRLTVAMSVGGVFKVPGSKTLAARRDVPIHSGLEALVARRSEGKQLGDYLFHELGDPDRHGDRSAAISKRFGRYREERGVHDREEGRRRSRVNFHSFRRWFITKALQAGQPTRTVQQVVGHKLQGMTEGVYFGGDTLEAKRACVEAVKLP